MFRSCDSSQTFACWHVNPDPHAPPCNVTGIIIMVASSPWWIMISVAFGWSPECKKIEATAPSLIMSFIPGWYFPRGRIPISWNLGWGSARRQSSSKWTEHSHMLNVGPKIRCIQLCAAEPHVVLVLLERRGSKGPYTLSRITWTLRITALWHFRGLSRKTQQWAFPRAAKQHHNWHKAFLKEAKFVFCHKKHAKTMDLGTSLTETMRTQGRKGVVESFEKRLLFRDWRVSKLPTQFTKTVTKGPWHLTTAWQQVFRLTIPNISGQLSWYSVKVIPSKSLMLWTMSGGYSSTFLSGVWTCHWYWE